MAVARLSRQIVRVEHGFREKARTEKQPNSLTSQRIGKRKVLSQLSYAPHLCQPDDQKSCAWCCGLYNVRDSSREVLISSLRARTRSFAETERSARSIQHFSEYTKGIEKTDLVDPDFYSCEFLGFLDTSETRVGCMLHPHSRGNGGIDWRGLSFYGAMACRGFFCRSHRELNSAEKRVLLGTIQDWYLYGLVVSDPDYPKSFFHLAAQELGNRFDMTRLLTPPASEVAYNFFSWKMDWPYGNRVSIPPALTAPRLSAARRTDTKKNTAQESLTAVDLIFRSLGTDFKTSRERRKAEWEVERLLSRLQRMM